MNGHHDNSITTRRSQTAADSMAMLIETVARSARRVRVLAFTFVWGFFVLRAEHTRSERTAERSQQEAWQRKKRMAIMITHLD